MEKPHIDNYKLCIFELLTCAMVVKDHLRELGCRCNKIVYNFKFVCDIFAFPLR